MELNISGRPRRTAQVTTAAPKTEKKSAGTGTSSALKRAGSDRVSWSQNALAFLQEVNRQDMEKRRKELEARQKNNGDLEMLSKALKTMERCQKIAARIMRGDRVPPQDEMYLMECDPDGYKLALVCRKPKEKPKEWESVLEEENQEGGSSGEEAAETVDSGGETAEA